MSRTGLFPITQQQARLLAAVGENGSRALEIANRSGVPAETVYPSLARLVGRKMLSKRGRQPPIYRLTAEGARQLAAAQAWQESLKRRAS